LPTPAVEAIEVPFMNHIDVLPRLSRHRMSAMPSPLKSPVATTARVVGTLPSAADDITVAPYLVGSGE
jgi:hypothetical protein